MHDFTMPQWAIDRVMERRGKPHIFDDINPQKTALIVVDLQNGFMVPEHTPSSGESLDRHGPERQPPGGGAARNRWQGGLDQEHDQRDQSRRVVELVRHWQAGDGEAAWGDPSASAHPATTSIRTFR